MWKKKKERKKKLKWKIKKKRKKKKAEKRKRKKKEKRWFSITIDPQREIICKFGKIMLENLVLFHQLELGNKPSLCFSQRSVHIVCFPIKSSIFLLKQWSVIRSNRKEIQKYKWKIYVRLYLSFVCVTRLKVELNYAYISSKREK